MSNSALKVLAASGAKGDPVYVDDVFSTYLHYGTGSAETIINGIDLDGEGGLIWLKNRSHARIGSFHDTERGVKQRLVPSTNDSENTVGASAGLSSFNSNGFSLAGGGNGWNASGEEYVYWSFRKQPGFFDVVTYTGTGNAGTAQTISHNLDSAPAVILVKNRSSNGDWLIFSKDTSQPHNKYLKLNDNVSEQNYDNIWGPNSYLPTTTEFKVDHIANESGDSYVAYLFANDDQRFGDDSDEAIIKSNKVSATGLMTVDLGFEPQWVLIKSVSINNGWILADSMRGLHAKGIGPNNLFPNLSSAEGTEDSDKINLTSTGFTFNSSRFNGNGDYLYIAIRRPHKPASEFAATDLFEPQTYTGDGSTRVFTGLSTTPDMTINKSLDVIGDANAINDRLRGSGQESYTNGADAQYSAGSAGMQFDYIKGIEIQSYRYTNTKDYINYHFKRAPGFFDIVAYTGKTGAQSRTHNLGAVPEMIWVKKRGSGIARNWAVYHSGLHATTPQNYYLVLNNNGQTYESSQYWNNTAPTASAFTTGGSDLVNGNDNTYVAYLFASVDGISKVGTYAGTGSDVNVDCGFSSGARWVMVKSLGSGDWYVWDSARGISAGNEPYWLLNSNSAEATGNDYIDPLSSGFTITSSAPTALNNSGDTYIFWAIA